MARDISVRFGRYNEFINLAPSPPQAALSFPGLESRLKDVYKRQIWCFPAGGKQAMTL